jgi:YjbE family integral membrane protein
LLEKKDLRVELCFATKPYQLIFKYKGNFLMDAQFWLALGTIIWVNIILSGDNAIVIALACRGLPEKQRFIGTVLGAGVAIVLRVIFTLLIAQLLGVPFLKIIGGLLLFWIAVKLVTDEAGEDDIASSDKLFQAVKTVAIADIVMSLDNVLAIAAVAKGNNLLMVLGLLISIPMIVAGAQLIMRVLERFPILIWAGAALLGYLAGEMLITDPFAMDMLAKINPTYVAIDANPMVGRKVLSLIQHGAGALGAAIVLAIAYKLKKKAAH